MSQQNILKEAEKGIRIYNQSDKKFYISLGGGKWKRDNEFISQWRRWGKKVTGKLKFDTMEGAATIGKDGTYDITQRIFTINDTSNPKIAKFLKENQDEIISSRETLLIKEQSDLYEKWDKVFTPIIARDIERFNKLYPNNPLTREIVDEYYAATNKQEFVKNHPVLKHYSHVHLPYDQEGRYKFGPTAGIFSKIIGDLDKVERFNKKAKELQNKFNVVPENNKDNKKEGSFYDYHRNLTKFLEDNSDLDKDVQKIVKEGTNQLNLLQEEVNNNLSHEELLGIGGNN